MRAPSLSSFEDLGEGFLRTAPFEKAEERLKRVRGIGDWSAQFILFPRAGEDQEASVQQRTGHRDDGRGVRPGGPWTR